MMVPSKDKVFCSLSKMSKNDKEILKTRLMFFKTSHTEAEAQKFCTLRVKLLILLVTLSAFAGTTTAILWPRDVTWQLTNLDVKDESSLMFFVMAFGKGMTNDTKLPDLVFLAGANLENPNFLGGTAMSGEFQVLYHDQVLGGGRSEPVQVPALGTGMVQVWGCLGTRPGKVLLFSIVFSFTHFHFSDQTSMKSIDL